MTQPVQRPILRLLNTLSGQVEPFSPLDPAGRQVKMYVCGPTVYDHAHLGHARCYITWDVLYRLLKFLDYDVTYVRNVTDVDDKILNRAAELGQTPAEVAQRNYESFQADMAALNTLPPDVEPKATDYIDEMQQGIQSLLAQNKAYVTADGSVYFRVQAKADYGKLKFVTSDPERLKRHLDDLKAGARVDVDEHKEYPLDFALWKAVPLTDPHGWSSPWPAAGQETGWGRPGWHMECSAMNHAVFGPRIDIHAGGADLIFPHHENEIAQSEAWTNQAPFARFWLHNGFVNVSGEKMSKSLGNFSTIKAVLARYDANAIRLFLLTNGYRMPVDFNDEALEAAQRTIARLYADFRQAEAQCASMDVARPHADACSLASIKTVETPETLQMRQAVEALCADLNTPVALAKLHALRSLLSETRQALQSYGPDAVDVTTGRTWGHALGQVLACARGLYELLGFDWQSVLGSGSDASAVDLPTDAIRTIYRELSGQWLEPDREPVALLKEIIAYRQRAKAIKNWTQADAIRKHLTDLGLQVLDGKDGVTVIEQDGREIVRV